MKIAFFIPFLKHPVLLFPQLAFCPLLPQPWCSLWFSGTHSSSRVTKVLRFWMLFDFSHQRCDIQLLGRLPANCRRTRPSVLSSQATMSLLHRGCWCWTRVHPHHRYFLSPQDSFFLAIVTLFTSTLHVVSFYTTIIGKSYCAVSCVFKLVTMVYYCSKYSITYHDVMTKMRCHIACFVNVGCIMPMYCTVLILGPSA